jgi:DMSO/TMAO reductase YedYZ molybdopterin-dependent catalytic subunit
MKPGNPLKPFSRRKLITAGLSVAAGATGLTAADKLARRYNLIPPDGGGLYGPGETLTYAAQRLITRHSMAREFSKSQICEKPFLNELAPMPEIYKHLQANHFRDWKLSIAGLVSHPASFSLSDIRALGMKSQITEIACEEGWSYIAQWTGTPLSSVLNQVGVAPHARYVLYQSIEKPWWESIDMADALHPQTILAQGMNDSDLPAGFGGPLRLRVPRQLGYKSVKFITQITVTDSLKSFGKGLGSASPEAGYSWFAGI